VAWGREGDRGRHKTTLGQGSQTGLPEVSWPDNLAPLTRTTGASKQQVGSRSSQATHSAALRKEALANATSAWALCCPRPVSQTPLSLFRSAAAAVSTVMFGSGILT